MVTVRNTGPRPARPTDQHSGKTDTDDGSEQCQLRKRNQRNRLAAYFERHVETVSNCDDGKVDTGGAQSGDESGAGEPTRCAGRLDGARLNRVRCE